MNEVHAHVSPARGIDVVLTANRAGTDVVTCDLHPDETGRLTVFAAAQRSAARPAASARRRQALALALSRDLGSVDYPGAAGVRLDATYATAEYAIQALGGSAAATALKPERHVAFLLRSAFRPSTFLLTRIRRSGTSTEARWLWSIGRS